MIFNKRFVLIVSIFFIAAVAYGQPGGGGDPGGGEPVPITGVEILLVGGAAIGLRKILGKKAQNSNTNFD